MIQNNFSNSLYSRNSLNNANELSKNSSNSIDAVYENGDKNKVSIENFLNLMIQQLKNQDFMNPTDDSQYLTQMAQFATMQQMQELAYYSKSNFIMGLAGKEVTVAKLGIGGKVDKVTGPVEKISLVNNEYKIYVKGKAYDLGQIMEIKSSSSSENLDKDEPTKGLSINIKEKTSDLIKISWPNANYEGKHKYSVYYSTDTNFNTVEEVKKGTHVGDFSDLNEAEISGLSPSTTYFINVVFTDENGNESVYSKGVATTNNS